MAITAALNVLSGADDISNDGPWVRNDVRDNPTGFRTAPSPDQLANMDAPLGTICHVISNNSIYIKLTDTLWQPISNLDQLSAEPIRLQPVRVTATNLQAMQEMVDVAARMGINDVDEQERIIRLRMYSLDELKKDVIKTLDEMANPTVTISESELDLGVTE